MSDQFKLSTWSAFIVKWIKKITASHCKSTCAWVLSHVRLCNPVDCSPPGSCVHGIFQARIQDWVAIFSSRGSSQPRGWTRVSCVFSTGRWIRNHLATWEAILSANCHYLVQRQSYWYFYFHYHHFNHMSITSINDNFIIISWERELGVIPKM